MSKGKHWEIQVIINNTGYTRYLPYRTYNGLSDQSSCLFLSSLQNTDDAFETPDEDESWASVTRLLNVSEWYLRESWEQLESRDFPCLVQMLSKAAELPTTANQSQNTVHMLSRSFIGLADALLSQENANKWEAIREVHRRPRVIHVYVLCLFLRARAGKECR